jgi:hypothetical protein
MPVEPGVEEGDAADESVCTQSAAAAVVRPQSRELASERNTRRPTGVAAGVLR